MISSDTLVMIACALGAVALIVAIWSYFSLRQRIDMPPERGRNSGNNNQIGADLANLKREFAMLSETVHRFRAQSLAGISENMAEKEQAIKQALSDEMHKELESATDEFDRALSAIVGKLDQKQEELAKRIDNFDNFDNFGSLSKSVDADQQPTRDGQLETKVSGLVAASVIDRFLASLEDVEDRRKCLLASLESVPDTVTFGKLAVAYPSANSWLILKELADRGVVSDIAGWALIAGAELTASKGQAFYATAEELYQAARLSFSTASNPNTNTNAGNSGVVNREGLYVIASGLARLLAHGDRAALSDMLKQEAASHLRILIESKPATMALPAVQLAEFYLNEERFECASILFRQVIDLATQVFPESIYKGDSAGRLWQGMARALANLVDRTGMQRELFPFFGNDTIAFLDSALAAKMPLSDADKQAMQLCLLRLCERDRDEDRALSVAKTLLDDGVRLAVDSENKERFNFIAVEILATVDELHLSRKENGMPMLKRLIGIFMAVSNHNKAASAGAKLVDASLDLYGDASLETVVPINILADVYKAMGRYDLAEECYRQILEIQYKVYPAEHEEMVDVLLNLAQVCKLQKDVGEAEIFLESAVEMCLSVFDKPSAEAADANDASDVPDQLQGRKKALMARAEALKGQLSHA